MSTRKRALSCSFTLALTSMLIAQPCIASRQRYALEQFKISKLRVYSISPARSDGSRYALVMDPSGFLHHVEETEYIGFADGLVKEITEHQIIVIEVRNVDGKLQEVSVILPLRRQALRAGA